MKQPYYWSTQFIESLLDRALEGSAGAQDDQPDLCVPSPPREKARRAFKICNAHGSASSRKREYCQHGR
jgi:hypothetical protein